MEPYTLAKVFAAMPRYYFNLFNDDVVADDEGTELPNLEKAKETATTSIRQLIAAHITGGQPV